MLKKIILVFISISLLVLFGSKNLTKADVGEVPGKGGIITPGDKTSQIKMTREKVIFDIKSRDNNSPFEKSPAKHYATVTADFEMYNQSSDDINMNLMFPIMEVPFVDPDYYEENSTSNQSLNFEILVDNKKVSYQHKLYKMESFQKNTDYEQEKVHALTFPIRFDSNEKTDIKISYDTRLVYEPKSIYGSFNYIMETGSHWKENIGSGKIIFKFPGEIDPNIFLNYNDFFEIENNKLIWNFKNLEPDESHNIRVTYSPQLMDTWQQKPQKIRTVESKGDVNLETSNIPKESKYSDIEYLGFGYKVESNPIFLTSRDNQHGWLTEFNNKNKPWVKFSFDKTYSIRSFSILSGISSKNNSQPTNSKAFYSLLSKPKTFKLEFSDGTSQIVSLKNTPAKKQTINFTEKETSYVKLVINETYKGETLEKEIVGIGQINLDIGDEAAQDENEFQDESIITEDNGSQTNQVQRTDALSQETIILLSILIILIIIIFIGVTIMVYRKRKKHSTTGQQ